MKEIETEILVIGSGIAGLIYALRCAEFTSVTVITKGTPEESNTRLAQGGIAAVFANNDSIEKHVQDTIIAGAGLCDVKVVRWLVSRAPDAIFELEKFGSRFDKNKNGTFDLHREGGHSFPRIIHAKDETGNEIENSLLRKAKSNPNIKFLSNHFAVDFLVENNCCYGVTVIEETRNELLCVYSKITFLATGGAGQVFLQNTNDEVATGDGFAMAHRAGAKILNMEFVQFHPTVFYAPGKKTFLITEAVRGFGAQLKNNDEESFMHKYHAMESLAPRDIVSRAIFNEMKENNFPCVYLDLRSFSIEDIKNHFPNLVNRCVAQKINLQTEMIPVVPAAHYMCGGVATDLNGQTSIQNLFAAGEVACTGVHGANRLASNSLLEAVVFAENASVETKKIFDSEWKYFWKNIYSEHKIIDLGKNNFSGIKIKLQKLMWMHCGIIRTENGLNRCYAELKKMNQQLISSINEKGVSFQKMELKNMIETAMLIVESASKRKNNIGCHYIEMANYSTA